MTNGLTQGRDLRAVLLGAYEKAYQEALPEECMPRFLPEKPKGKTYVIGAGKAAAKMAQVFEKIWDADLTGLVVTRYGYELPTERIEVLQAAHPVPDEAGQRAARRILDLVQGAGPDDLVICLLSGGGSALLTAPFDGLIFENIQNLYKQLLHAGASIQEINVVRKHLNISLGGRIALAAAPARLVTLAISDVAGDDPATIASGPTVGDPSCLQDVADIVRKYDVKLTPEIAAHLQNPASETPKPDHPAFQKATYHLIAAPEKSLQVAADYVRAQGFTPYILSSELEGDTNEAAGFHTALIKRILAKNEPFARPCALLSGGETTVKVTGSGKGGPNSQFMLASAVALKGDPHVYGLACDTDGIDGNQDCAGAVIDPTTLARAEALGMKPKRMMENNDSNGFFTALQDCVTPGPTFTNVNDFRLFLIV